MNFTINTKTSSENTSGHFSTQKDMGCTLKNGELVIDYLYDYAGSLSAGKASVQNGNEGTIYIDKTGMRK